MDCLEGHRHADGFGADCRTSLKGVMEARAMDFRLDAPLRQARILWIDSHNLIDVQGHEPRGR